MKYLKWFPPSLLQSPCSCLCHHSVIFVANLGASLPLKTFFIRKCVWFFFQFSGELLTLETAFWWPSHWLKCFESDLSHCVVKMNTCRPDDVRASRKTRLKQLASDHRGVHGPHPVWEYEVMASGGSEEYINWSVWVEGMLYIRPPSHREKPC